MFKDGNVAPPLKTRPRKQAVNLRTARQLLYTKTQGFVGVCDQVGREIDSALFALLGDKPWSMFEDGKVGPPLSTYSTKSVHKVVLQKSISAQICQFAPQTPSRTPQLLLPPLQSLSQN